jgi:hypothetical protein
MVIAGDVDDLDAFVTQNLLDVYEEFFDLLWNELHLRQSAEHILRGDEPPLSALGREHLRRFLPGFVENIGHWRRRGDRRREVG